MSIELTSENLKQIKEKYGEAFYILDSDGFARNFKELKCAFEKLYSNFHIAYSYKTNYTPKLCKIVNELGGYAEVVSEMELELALRIGVEPQNIIWNGPIKNKLIVEDFLLRGGAVNIDSEEEMKTIADIVLSHPQNTFRLGIRCNYDVGDGVISRFGFDTEAEGFDKVLSFIVDTPNIRFCSLQCHFAKRQIEYWPARVKGMLELIDRIGVIPERIDLGGALFGKMADSLKVQFSSPIPEYCDYASVAARLFSERFGANGPQLVIEPGSALVGDCMKFVGTVKTIKNIRGKYFASILASQKNISMAGVNPPIEIIPSGNEAKKYDDIDMVGFTCIEGDLIYKGYSGNLAVGDSVVISNCGSYSIVMKPPFILPNFPIIDLCGDEIEVIKRAESFDDIFRTYCY